MSESAEEQMLAQIIIFNNQIQLPIMKMDKMCHSNREAQGQRNTDQIAFSNHSSVLQDQADASLGDSQTGRRLSRDNRGGSKPPKREEERCMDYMCNVGSTESSEVKKGRVQDRMNS
ncbi:unnamed protein product [Caretta caretta]